MDLIAQNLTARPGEEFHLNDISFALAKGQLYTILGRTLAGKTTLLKTIAGLHMPDSGQLHFNGRDLLQLPVWERNIAMVYQQFINYPHLSVYDNIAFPLRQHKLAKTEIAERVMQSLDSVGLIGFETRKIQALSGGQQQRVALARSLASLKWLAKGLVRGLAKGWQQGSDPDCAGGYLGKPSLELSLERMFPG